MFKTKANLLLASIAFALMACNSENEDVTNAVNKSGSVETDVHTAHIDSMHDELITKHTIWVKNNVFKTVEYRDTIPALGKINTVAENEDGDTKDVLVEKDYEIYITVK